MKPELLNFNNITKTEGIKHFISSRKGGVSSELFSSLNLGNFSEDKAEIIEQNRQILANNLGVKKENLIFPQQVHSSNIQIVTQENYKSKFSETDALITNCAGIFICILVADCVPILLCDPYKKVVAAVHAGWRGTVSGIVEKTTEIMQNIFNCKPQNILAGIGPAICNNCYEIGIEVEEAVREKFADHSTELLHKRNEKTYFNLWLANRRLLLKNGLSPENIEIMDRCTVENPEVFFSYRRDGQATGRFASGIFIEN